MFSKNFRLVYLYLVSMIALLVTVFAVIATANAIMAATVGYPWYDTMEYVYRVEDRLRQYRSIFNSCAFWVVSLPVYLFHWREIEKGRKAPEAVEIEETAGGVENDG